MMREARGIGGASRMRIREWMLTPIVLFVFAAAAIGQMGTATILGVVKDSTGAVIPGASLTARNVETGQTRTAVSGGNGAYRFTALPVGSYEVQAEQAGFRVEARRGLTLTVGQEAVVDFTLEVGAVTETVEVSAEAPLVNTTSGELGGLVDHQKMADLPLNGRNYQDLAILQPGIAVSVNHSASKQFATPGVWVSANGAPTWSNNYVLDGAMMIGSLGMSSGSVSNTTLGIEGVREFRVVTSSTSADYGMVTGNQTIMVSKGGTNEFHGSLFEYLRNDVLDARNFFDYKTEVTPRRLPAFRRNQFGGSLGGPIKRDNTFFHVVYESLRERLGVTSVGDAIPLSARVDGGLVQKIDPRVKIWLREFPVPNLSGNRFTYDFSQPTDEHYGQGRVDHTFSAADSLFGRYTVDDALLTSSNYPQFQSDNKSRYQFATLSETHIFSSTLLNTARMSFTRTVLSVLNSPTAFIGPDWSLMAGQGVGTISIGGIGGSGDTGRFGPTGQALHKQNIFQWGDDLFYSRGRHSLKFGALINHFQSYVVGYGAIKGSISFLNLASFLEGRPRTFSGITPGSKIDPTYTFNTLGFYVQDDMPVRSNLTLNLGLRYEIQTGYIEESGLGGTLRDVYRDTAFVFGEALFKNPSLKNFSPRVGFAWDVRGDGKTAIRGGFGVLYDLGNINGFLLAIGKGTPPVSRSSANNNPVSFTLPFTFTPENIGKNVATMDYQIRQPHMLQYNLAVQRQLPGDMALTLAYVGTRGINMQNATEGNPTVPQILSDGRKFWTGRELRINPAWQSVALKTAAVNSFYNGLQFGLAKRLSRGLQFQSSYTWSKVIDELQGHISDSSSQAASPVDPADLKRERAVATFDITQVWRFNTTYRLPELAQSSGFASKLLNGWWMSGILSLVSGPPFTLVVTNNRSRSQVGGTNADRPNLVAGRTSKDIVSGVTAGCPGVKAGQKLGTPDLYFDPCAFELQPAGFLGNLGRNALRGPGLANLDFSLAKDTPLGFLGESGKLEFRAEFFNILNRANFSTAALARAVFAGARDGEAPLSTAGRITGTDNSTSRQIQFALKILF